MIRFVMLSLVLMVSFSATEAVADSSERTISTESVRPTGEIEAIDRYKKTKITVNGVMYSVSRATKVKVAGTWAPVSNLSVGDTIHFEAKAAKRSSQLPEMISIELQLN